MISIVVLVVNDHLLKQTFPGAITGKLSDFSGLYFFPFLIAIGLSFLLRLAGQQRRGVGVFAFLFAGALFVSIKTIPSLNALIEGSLAVLTGRPTVIVLDSSDLIALTVLFPSWRLWEQSAPTKVGKSGWLLVGIASFASIATSIIEPSVISNLYVQGDTIYAEASDQRTWFESTDNGQSWQYLSEVPLSLSEQPDRDHLLSKTLCDSEKSNWCIRISGEGFVESSYDVGATWTVAWDVPPGRRMFMDRLTSGLLGGIQIELGPYDVVFAGSPSDRRAVIAMGNQGILLINEEGEWSRVPTDGESYPTPFVARDVNEVLNVIGGETSFVFAIAMIAWILLNRLYWQPVLDAMGSQPSLHQFRKWVTKPLMIARLALLAWLASFVILFARGFLIFQGWLPLVAVFVTLVAPFVGQFASRRRLAEVLANSLWPVKGLWPLVWGIVALIIFGLAPLVLWALGTIPWYGIALLVSVSLAVATSAWATRQIRYHAAMTIQTILEGNSGL